MKSRSFGDITKKISPIVQEHTDATALANLRKEVNLAFGDATGNNDNKSCDLWLENKLPDNQWPHMDGPDDVGWQQRGSGRKRNSKSGHALIIGSKSGLAVAKAICLKTCGFCKSWRTKNSIDLDPPQHKCFKNHEGSTGSMEPIAVLKMHAQLLPQQHGNCGKIHC